MVVAYGTRRTMILDSRGWRYANEGWETVFLPFSDTCVSRDGYSSRSWGREYSLAGGRGGDCCMKNIGLDFLIESLSLSHYSY